MRQKFSFARQGLGPRDGTGVSNSRRVRVAQSHRAVVAGGAMGARRRRAVPFTDGGGRLGRFGGDARGGASRQGSLWLLQCSLRSSLSGFALFLAVWTRCGCFCSSPAGATRDGRCCFPARVLLGIGALVQRAGASPGGRMGQERTLRHDAPSRAVVGCVMSNKRPSADTKTKDVDGSARVAMQVVKAQEK